MKNCIFVLLILIVAGTLRSLYCYHMPVSGDESVSLLQSAGKALEYNKQAPIRLTRIEELQDLMKYSPEYGVKNVLDSMEKAGVHPPVYYVLLHYLIRFFGNEAFLCRVPSILFSTFSVLMLYLLCKRLFSTAEALFAAMTLAMAAYGVHYSQMIRPYPMMMFISITSTWLMLKMYQAKMIRFSSATLWAYFFVTLLGLYGIYHYLFTVLCQAVFLILATWKNKKQWLIIGSMFFIVGLLYLPWIPKLMTQLQFVQTGELYFHGISNPVRPLRFLFEFNLTRALPGDYAWYKFILLGLFFAATVIGIGRCLSMAISRYFTIAVAASFIAVYAADLIMRSNTMNVPKLLFFLNPMLIVYFSVGAVYLIKRFTRIGPSLVFIMLLAICVNTAYTIKDPKPEDDPKYLSEYQKVINSVANRNTAELLILNQTNVRYMQSFAHVIESGDIEMHAFREWEDFNATEDLADCLEKYDWIFIAAPRVHRSFNAESIAHIQEVMQQYNFTLNQPDNGKDLLEAGCLLVFQKKMSYSNPEN